MTKKRIDSVDREVGQRIRRCRLAAGVSQTKLADALGVTFQQIQKYEKGNNRLSAGRLTKIATVLGVSVRKLIEGADAPSLATTGARETEIFNRLLSTPGASQLLHAYSKLPHNALRRSIVQMIESLVKPPPAEAKP
jgi:transcriptional regulator with XRE-family HTH domain